MFQITNPARGRKRRLQLLQRLIHVKFQITNPARGRKQSNHERDLLDITQCFKSQTPQGDGNFVKKVPQLWDIAKVSNHKPRKGTETGREDLLAKYLENRFKSQTPQGDGNNGRLVFLICFGVIVSNHKPRKGTETRDSFMHYLHSFVLVSNHKPRKGTETLFLKNHKDIVPICFKSQTPQGDGNHLPKTLHLNLHKVSNHKPRKGTETCNKPILIALALNVSNHKPRKGTETNYSVTRSITMLISFKSQTPQGDGNPGMNCSRL